jgi:hypothetical protein
VRLIFLYGLPATGKLTVGRELQALTGYRLFHNHLAVDLLLSVFEFGSAPFVELREQIWLSVIEQACRAALPGLIFTFNPENTVRPGFPAAVAELVASHSGQLDLVELICPLQQVRQRLGSGSRTEHRKLTSIPLFDQLHASGALDTAHMPPAKLTLDTALCSPSEAARSICDALQIVTP